MQLQPAFLKLDSLLNGRLFRIPEYQRAYSWEKKQRSDLFNDIKRIRKSGDDHFLSTVVGLIRDKVSIVATEFDKVDLVDGQQRITTLVILLKAIEKEMDRSDPKSEKLATEIRALLVKEDELCPLLLQTNHDSSHIFTDYVRDGSVSKHAALTSADQNLVDAIRECEEFVRSLKSDGNGSLIELLGLLRNRLWLIFHSIGDEALVYKVFEVLNSRGLDVSWFDKLKSQLIAVVFDKGDKGGKAETSTALSDVVRT